MKAIMENVEIEIKICDEKYFLYLDVEGGGTFWAAEPDVGLSSGWEDVEAMVLGEYLGNEYLPDKWVDNNIDDIEEALSVACEPDPDYEHDSMIDREKI
mgnify:CR=1 FL=1